ncbi:hypothetical protein Sphch_1481 [Sphingobium chlorophenolicum L-1]|uniref:Uncharacterized protein n=1 Tax=Sphingobium chlorophenolicum L-1 TaxID=690566 RepID=F6EY63_SPHCR|nr:hypothetical protein [Sphingobium chlorophenolicum]AEG49169.1 hypothetical protein Sphch_1481 [Sphingobium chlorophenolicum L-1]
MMRNHFLKIFPFITMTLWTGAALAAPCPVPNAISNGQVADAAKVMDNFNAVAQCYDETIKPNGTPTAGSIAVFSDSKTIASGDLTGDITTSGGTTTTLSNSGVTPGTYTNPNIVVDAKGRVTAASSAPGGAGGGPALIASVTTTSGQSSVTFSSIPSTYTHLQIIGDAAVTSTNSLSTDVLGIQFNGDTGNNYRFTLFCTYASGSGCGNGSTSTNSAGAALIASNGASGVPFGGLKIDIPNYLSANQKSVLGHSGVIQGNVGPLQGLGTGNWTGTSAVTSITLVNRGSSNFATGSKFWLYAM